MYDAISLRTFHNIYLYLYKTILTIVKNEDVRSSFDGVKIINKCFRYYKVMNIHFLRHFDD